MRCLNIIQANLPKNWIQKLHKTGVPISNSGPNSIKTFSDFQLYGCFKSRAITVKGLRIPSAGPDLGVARMMGDKKKNKKEGLFQGVLMAYLILILHVLLIGGLGFLVFFFSGIVQHFRLIFFGGMALLMGSGYFFYRKMKKEGKNFRDMINAPLLSGRSVEVSFLGGLASLKVGPSINRPMLTDDEIQDHPLLEDPSRSELTELKDLARLLKDGLITRDEYETAKNRLFGNIHLNEHN